MRVARLWVLICLFAAAPVAADFFPLEDVKAGMRGTGRTVFRGDQIEEFQVEILGVLENVAPKQSIILARLSGGPLEKTGVMAGMSGSPVYLDGKLAGAVAYTFPFTTEPIAGLRPIEEMVAGAEAARQQSGSPQAQWRPVPGNAPLREASTGLLPAAPPALETEPRLIPIATPVNLGGFSQPAFEIFGPRLRELGLRPVQGIAGSSRVEQEAFSNGGIEPGAMITVALIRGDMELSAAGTVTHVDGDRVYAFGHQFLASGSTELPFSRASVITLVPNLSSSFKIAGSGPLLGALDGDHSSGVTGILGKRPKLTPLKVALDSERTGKHEYSLEVVNDRSLTPFLLQTAVFSAVSATERLVGASTLRVAGTAKVTGAEPPLQLDDLYAGSSNLALQAATSTALKLYYLLQGGRTSLEEISLSVNSSDEERWVEIDRVWTSKTKVRPGEVIELSAALKSVEGPERIETAPYRVPAATAPGELNITFSDAATINLAEWRNLVSLWRSQDPGERIRSLNDLRTSDRLYVRVWRPERGFRFNSERLAAPPPSVTTILSGAASTEAGASEDWQSILDEFSMAEGHNVVRGNVTTKITVTE